MEASITAQRAGTVVRLAIGEVQQVEGGDLLPGAHELASRITRLFPPLVVFEHEQDALRQRLGGSSGHQGPSHGHGHGGHGGGNGN